VTSFARRQPSMRLRWSDPQFRALVWQMVVVGLVVALLWWLVDNARRNLEIRRIASGFGFLASEAGLPIGEALIAYSPADSYGRALLAGALNTLRVAAVGIVFATVLGTLIGIARLSRNWLLAKLALLYVEVIRGLPLLLQLLFVYTMLQSLPAPRQALQPIAGIMLSNRGLALPTMEWRPAHLAIGAVLLCGCFAALVYRHGMIARRVRDGRPRRVWPAACVLVLLPPVVLSLALDAPWALEWPRLRGFNIHGGMQFSPEYFALFAGLTLYTAAFIAEIVRSGILAVGTGQWEAAKALGLDQRQILRLIVLPQALRVIIPPTTSQYLNLTKNSSLAVAIGYQDIVSIANTTINQTGQAIEGIAIIMAVYLSISLSISAFMNWYNGRIALVGR
jgi:general L-amino acid transport system permease protein